MILLLALVALAGEGLPVTVSPETMVVEDIPEEIYVHDASISDEVNKINKETVNTIIVGTAVQYAHHYFNVDSFEPFVFDKYSNTNSSECDYTEDLYECSKVYEHWLISTNIHLSDEVLTVAMRIYDPTGRLRAASSNNVVIKTVCRTPPRRRVPHPTQGSVPYDPPEECKEVNPKLLTPFLRQTMKILLSNVRP